MTGTRSATKQPGLPLNFWKLTYTTSRAGGIVGTACPSIVWGKGTLWSADWRGAFPVPKPSFAEEPNAVASGVVPDAGRSRRSKLGRWLSLYFGLQVFQLFSQPRLAPGEIPGVENENQPNETISQEEKFVSHAIPSGLAVTGRAVLCPIPVEPQPTTAAGEEDKKTGREMRPN